MVVVPDDSIQSKIDQYRQQITKSSDSVEEPQINFFEVNKIFFSYFNNDKNTR